MKTLVMLLLLLFTPALCMACFAPPSVQVVPYEELIRRTHNIALAKVVSIKELKTKPRQKFVKAGSYTVMGGEKYYTYTFEVIEPIKGDVSKVFEIDGKAELESDNTFDNHTDGEFWNRRGRTGNGVDCQIHPQFQKGGTYLIFMDEPYHRKSFEKIETADDKWLLKVREISKAGKANE